MREIKADLNSTVRRINKLKGIPLIMCVNKGRNKFTRYEGSIKEVFPAVFTFVSNDVTSTFCISDVHTKNIKFYQLNTD